MLGENWGKFRFENFGQKVFIFFKNLHHCFLLRLIKNYFRYCIRFSSENLMSSRILVIKLWPKEENDIFNLAGYVQAYPGIPKLIQTLRNF